MANLLIAIGLWLILSGAFLLIVHSVRSGRNKEEWR